MPKQVFVSWMSYLVAIFALSVVAFCDTGRGDGAVHVQLAAFFRSPVPEYFAYCGYGQSGRDRPDCGFPAMICAGATRRSRHCSSVPIVSNVCGPSPPRQCPMPGTMKRRVQSSWSLPILFKMLS